MGGSTGITSRYLVDPAFVMRRFVDMGATPSREQQSFQINLFLQQISVFCRHYETSEALSRIPLFCIAQIGFPQLARVEEKMLLEADIDPQNTEAITAFRRSLDPFRQVLTYPLGQVVTDHAGYASFDLTALSQDSLRNRLAAMFETLSQELVGRAVNSPALQRELAGAKPEIGLVRLWVLPFTDMTLGIDALKSGDVAPNFIALRVDLSADELDGRERDRSGAAMQHPSILDWRLSPGSFTMSNAAILGEDGCETLLPTNLSTQQFRFKQVIRSRASADVVEPGGQRFIVPKYAFAHVAEYVSEWFPIGHSLGQILYSLPLAPGEKVKIAVVDWSRTDTAKRDEKTTFVEQLQHSQLRDRSLTEAVHVALSEWQTGNSMMGGFAASASAAIPVGPIDIGLGQALSLGASSASLEGGRDVTADTVQKISDAFQQASSAVRELKSTVVVQSEQSEQSNVQTRVVANYNHSHALTMLYYEVLRHYRITTRLDKIRPALRVKYGGTPDVKLNSGSFSAAFLLGKRHMLESRLLDTRLLPCFDSMNRVASGEMKLARETATWEASTQTVDPADKEFVKFRIQFTTSGDREGDTNQIVFVNVYLTNGIVTEHPCPEGGHFGRSKEFEHWFPTPQRWRSIEAIEIWLRSPDDWKLTNITLTMVTASGEGVLVLGDNGEHIFNSDRTNSGRLPILRPPPATTTARAGSAPLRSNFVSADDDYSVQALIDHCNANRGHYLRVLRLAEDPNQRVAWMESLSVAGFPLLEVIENRPLEIFGDYVTYPINPGYETALATHFHAEPVDSETWSMSFIEQLASLPSRGVFGEAKLGHCNASELIDTSRFWDWQTSPIPDDAPEISGADAGTRKEKVDGLAPTAFPQSIVNIATPQALPDPTGLSGAFGLLSALGPFKDITGQKELGALLTTLSNNATSLAAKGMDVQQTKRLIDMVNSAPRVSNADKGQMITSALQDLCKPATPPVAPPTTPPGPGSTPPTSPPVDTGSGGGGTVRPAPKNRVKPDKKNGRVLKFLFKKINKANKPRLLNMLDLVSFGSYSNADITSTQFIPVTESNVEIPSNGTANLICTYEAHVFDEAALQAATQRTMEEAKASWYEELKKDAQWVGEAATGVLFWKKVYEHFLASEGKSLSEKLTQRVPVLSVSPTTYLRPTEKTFEGNGHWLFKDTSPDLAVLEVTPVWTDAGKVTVAVTTSSSGEIGVEVKGGVSGKIVAIDLGIPLKFTSQVGGTTTYEIPVKELEDTVTVIQTI